MIDNKAPNKKANGKVKEITSLANPIIKDIKALSLKKNRDREGVFMAEGLKLVLDAQALGWKIKTLLFAKSGLGNKLIEKAAAHTVASGGLVIEASQKVMETVTRRDNPQNVVGIFEQQWQLIQKINPEKQGVYLVLDRIRDPGNLGTIIRTADAVGAKGVILLGDTTDPYSLETVRATMGSIFALPLYKVSEQDFLTWQSTIWQKKYKGKMIGTHLKGAVDYRHIDYKNAPILMVMGNEQQGLTDALANQCDALARIPQAGMADSLNLAVATGVMLYEIRRHALLLDERDVFIRDIQQ